MSEAEIKELQRKYTGVVYHKQERKWRARYYKADGKRTWLKDFYKTAEQAAKAYDKAVLDDGLPAQPVNFVSPEARMAAEKKRQEAANPSSSADTKTKEAGSLSDLIKSAPIPAPLATKSNAKPKTPAGTKRKRVSDDSKKNQQQDQPDREAATDSDIAKNDGASKESTSKKTEDEEDFQPVKKRRAKNKQRRERQRENKRKDIATVAEKAAAVVSDAQELQAKSMMRTKPVPLASHMPKKAVVKMETDEESAEAWTTRRPEGRIKIDPANVNNEALRDVVGLVELTATSPGYKRYYEPLLEKFDKESWVQTVIKSTEDMDSDDNEEDSNGQRTRLFGLDCEMVLCRPKGAEEDVQPISVLARVSLVECKPVRQSDKTTKLHHEVIFDDYVQTPDEYEVVDLLTHVSGIEQKHLDKAKLPFKEAQEKVVKHVSASDIVVGHSLWSDFGALHLWHCNIVDTTALCGIRNLPDMTLSLKDAAVAVLHDQSELEQFQESGESHDSVDDAKWSVRVMFKLLELSQTRKVSLPLLFNEIPDRYRARLTFHLLPVGTTEDGVKALVMDKLPEDTDASQLEVRQVRWNERRDGSKVGSVVVDMATPELAYKVFSALPCVQSGCGGYDNSPPCCRSGWPDRQGMPRKLIRAPSPPEGFNVCELISYFPVELKFTKKMRIKTTVLGRLMGPMGRTVLMIQQVCGARIVITQQADKDCRNKMFRKAAQIEISADSQVKLDQAVQMVHSSMKNELPVQQRQTN